jgi:hypothetical protein
MHWALTAVCLVGAAAAVVTSRARTGDWISPSPLVAVVWLTTFGLYSLHLLPYQPASAKSSVIILFSILTLEAGILFGGRLVPAGGEALPAASGRLGRPDAWVTGYALAGLAGFGWYVAQVVWRFGWEGFRAPGPIRWALGAKTIPSEFLFLQFFCIVAPVVAATDLLIGIRLRRLAVALASLCTLLLWLTTDRTQFVAVIASVTFLCLLRFGPSLSLRQAAGIGFAGAALVVTNFLVVGAWLGKTPKNLGVALTVPVAPAPAPLPTRSPVAAAALPPMPPVAEAIPPAPATAPPPVERVALHGVYQKFTTLYLYMTGSYPAFSLLVSERPERTRGKHTFYPILRALERVGLYRGGLPRAIPPFRNVTLGAENRIDYNGYSYLYYPYSDFGVAGCIVVSALMGLLSGFVYAKVRRDRTAGLWLVLASQICFALLLSTFVNKFNNTASWYVALFAALPFLRRAR